MKKTFVTILILLTCTLTAHAQISTQESPKYSTKELKQLTKKADKGDVESMVKLYKYHLEDEHGDSTLIVHYLQRAADAGDAEAQTSLGACFQEGFLGLQRDEQKGFYYIQKAAAQGYDMAIYNLGLDYLYGIGVAKDLDKALSYFKQAAMSGVAQAQYFYAAGIIDDSVTTDQGVFWLQKSADQGYVPANSMLARYYINKEDYEKALKNAQIAASTGDAEGEAALATLYYYGCGVNKDLDQARYWAQQAADQEHSAGYTILGSISCDEGNYLYALPYLQKGAELENNQARLLLADIYHEGKSVEKDTEKAYALLKDAIADGNEEAQKTLDYYHYIDSIDDASAIEQSKLSAESDDPNSLLLLAARYQEGKGVEKDLTKAFNLTKQAADMGHAPAQAILSWFYTNGLGTEKNLQKAFEYTLKAAKQDYENAYGDLANLYYNGIGTPVNYPEARYWGEKGIELGDTAAYYIMGLYYYEGKATPTDHAKSLSYFQKCAELGSGDGYYGCFLCHTFGAGDMRNHPLAFKELQQAIKLLTVQKGENYGNLIVAYYNMGVCYESGKGTAKDFKNAFHWFLKAAQCNYTETELKSNKNVIANAQFAVSGYYYQGQGTPLNRAKAKYWLRKAAANGSTRAKEALKTLKF